MFQGKESEKKKKIDVGTPLVAQGLRNCLSVQERQVPSLVKEDPTCRGATKPTCLEPVLCNEEAPAMKSPNTATRGSPATKTQCCCC